MNLKTNHYHNNQKQIEICIWLNPFFTEPREEEAAEDAELHDSVNDSLAKHCFDMDMNEIRTIITTVLSPPDKPLGL